MNFMTYRNITPEKVTAYRNASLLVNRIRARLQTESPPFSVEYFFNNTGAIAVGSKRSDGFSGSGSVQVESGYESPFISNTTRTFAPQPIEVILDDTMDILKKINLGGSRK